MRKGLFGTLALSLAQNGPLQFELPQPVSPRLASTKTPSDDRTGIVTRDGWKRRERESIAGALKQSGGKVFGEGGAAELFNMKPTTLASRIKALSLR